MSSESSLASMYDWPLNPIILMWNFSGIQISTHFWSSELQSLLKIKSAQMVNYLKFYFQILWEFRYLMHFGFVVYLHQAMWSFIHSKILQAEHKISWKYSRMTS